MCILCVQHLSLQYLIILNIDLYLLHTNEHRVVLVAAETSHWTFYKCHFGDDLKDVKHCFHCITERHSSVLAIFLFTPDQITDVTQWRLMGTTTRIRWTIGESCVTHWVTHCNYLSMKLRTDQATQQDSLGCRYKSFHASSTEAHSKYCPMWFPKSKCSCWFHSQSAMHLHSVHALLHSNSESVRPKWPDSIWQLNTVRSCR